MTDHHEIDADAPCSSCVALRAERDELQQVIAQLDPWAYDGGLHVCQFCGVRDVNGGDHLDSCLWLRYQQAQQVTR